MSFESLVYELQKLVQDQNKLNVADIAPVIVRLENLIENSINNKYRNILIEAKNILQTASKLENRKGRSLKRINNGTLLFCTLF